MPKHILISDDEADILETARIRLEAAGYKVSATMGDKTLADARRLKPDLILLDVIMPGLDGFGVIRELKRDTEVSAIPVIVFSGKPKSAMMELFGPEGIAGYISKPYEPQEFLQQIKQVLGE